MEVKATEVAASMKRWPVTPARGQGSARPSGDTSDPWKAPTASDDDIPPF